MTFKKNDKVKILRNIYRWDGHEFDDKDKRIRILYAKEGDLGVILEIFKPERKSINYAKVVTDNKCKTFRLTSIEKL